MRFGYKLCSEERTAAELVADAEGAEAAGFDLAAVSDHFHPWLDAQGQSPFAWTVLGAIARATERLTIGTAVTCPTVRLHPAIVAQAAATTATLLPGRWFLGVGTGERLNEHVVGGDWPEPDARRAMLREAIVIIRRLWSGDETSYQGAYLQVEAARLYSLPEEPPPLYVAASGEGAATLAAELGDGLITTAPDAALVDAFRSADGEGPVLGEVTACWGMPEDDAIDELRRRWPLPGIGGDASTELSRPADFARAAGDVTAADLRGKVVTGVDPSAFVEQVRGFADAGFTHVVLHQVGIEQAAFQRAAEQEILPGLREAFGEVNDRWDRPAGAAATRRR
jgi:coenzyme F420-dependent glucose-6-phosphate dehydrogenase